MNINRIKTILIKNLGLVIVFPLLVAVLVYFLVWDQPQQYVSRALVYTGFASGYNLESAEGGNSNGNEYSNFDNLINTIKAKSTLEEVSIQLLAQYLSSSPSITDSLLHEDAAAFLAVTIPAEYRTKAEKMPYENLVEDLMARLKENELFTKEVVTSGSSPFSIPAILSTLQAKRLESSDMLEVTYQTSDAALAQVTLSVLIDTFVKKYKDTKTGEIKSVVTYFENQLKTASASLKNKEDSLQMYSSANKIINFEEDSRAISTLRQNLESQIQQEMSTLASTEAVLNQLNAKMGRVKETTSNNIALNNIKDSLSALNSKLFLLQNNPGRQENVSAIQAKIRQLESRERNTVVALAGAMNTGEGVPSSMLLTTWIDAMLEVDRTKSRIRSLKELQMNKQSEFNSILPAGVVINRLKRDIALAEQNYLQVLQNLNASRLKEQSVNTTLNLRVVDAPSRPESAEPSKTNVLIGLSFFAALFLVIGYLISKDMMDTRIKDMEGLRNRIRLPFAGALPDMSNAKAISGNAEVQLFNQCINTINIHFKEDASPLVIVLFSTQSGDGKTFYGKKLLRYLNASGYKTVLSSSSGRELGRESSYNHSNHVAVIPGYGELTSQGNISKPPYEIVLVELEPINQNVLPIHLLKRADLSLVIVPAHRKWTSADDHILEIFKTSIAHPVFSILNRISWEEAKSLMGNGMVKHKVETIEVITENQTAGQSINKKPVTVVKS